MVRGIVLLSGSSHPTFVESVAAILGVEPSARVLAKFSSGETRCEIQASVRGKDVYIFQSFGVGDEGKEGEDGRDGDTETGVGRRQRNTVNDYFIELCIMISACKMGGARRVTAVMPLFPYSRQPDLPFSRVGAPLQQQQRNHHQHQKSDMGDRDGANGGKDYTFDSAPTTPGAHTPKTTGLGGAGVDVVEMMRTVVLGRETPPPKAVLNNNLGPSKQQRQQQQQQPGSYTTHDYENPSVMMALEANSGHKQFMAHAGSLVADLLTCAGADRVLTCDLHESAYQGFFDIPVDNLYARPLLQRYIQQNIPNYRDAVIVSPDAGGAKRATAIADSLGLAFALIHKERRPPKLTPHPKSTMTLVGAVSGRVCILIDDLVDTGSTIVRAARLLKREGAARVVALLTHGVFSGDAAARVFASSSSGVDRVVVTNTVPQGRNLGAACGMGGEMEVLDVSAVFAEAARRVHHGESVSGLFQYD
ncbi:phosphoribosyltransferase-like protein [Staphylotrichum tortipilum]|uniref:ribose-phosphate diphosphokinase n=1 Tax=Staphylotrichum tortipilum TaxID=2831512 RepID=A0AAN6MQF1_9PEZI|nr:phosphoribosyltransferase-like protein [Staphylotrichum longicolle]